MSDNKETKGLLDKILRSFSKKNRIIKGKVGKEFKTINKFCPHGVYLYIPERDAWKLILVDNDYWKPEEDGIYVVYFDNTKCPACRIYDSCWFKLVKERSKDAKYVIVLCSWFSLDCNSKAALRTFEKYEVHASPTTLFICRRNGKTLLAEKYEGVLELKELTIILTSLRSSCL